MDGGIVSGCDKEKKGVERVRSFCIDGGVELGVWMRTAV